MVTQGGRCIGMATMAQREVRAFDYVNQPSGPVRDFIKRDAGAIFRTATKVAEVRTGELRHLADRRHSGVEVSKEISIRVGAIREEEGPRHSRVTHVEPNGRRKSRPGSSPS